MVVSLAVLSFGCRQAKYVQDGNYLLKSNEVFFPVKKKRKVKLETDHPLIDVAEVEELIRPTPNRSLKLYFYNRIDTTRHQRQVNRKREKYRRKNERRKTRENKINNRRIDRAREKGDSLYRQKVISEKDVKLGWREWVRSNLGQAPVLLDTVKVRKSHEQIDIYLRKKGFYSAEVRDTIIYKERKKKAFVEFHIKPGEPYRIREFKLDSASMNAAMLRGYKELIKESDPIIIPGNLLDQDVLDEERSRLSQYCRNEKAMFGFNKNYIGYAVDTTVGHLEADVTMFVKPKVVKDPTDSLGERKIEIDHLVYKVKDVTFYLHNPDPASFDDFKAYRKRCDSLQSVGRFYPDTLNQFYQIKGKYPLLDTMRIEGKGTFVYNEIPYLKPELLDRQNFLEIDMASQGGDSRFYKEYYVERSYRTFSNLGVFSNISPRIEVDPEAPLSRWVVVTYDLMPLKRQSILFEPRVSNTNGILGIQGSVSYANKNLFRGGQQLQISFTGGMESQPLIVGTDDAGHVQRAWQLNTFEWGPKISLTFPKLILPISRKMQEGVSKRAYPKTIFDLTINYQKRSEFKRTLTELGYSVNFQQDKVQRWEVGLVGIDYVRLEKEAFFQERLEQLNDPFLLNSYTDHFTTILNPTYYYSNLNSNRRSNNNLHNIIASMDVAGKLLTPLAYGGLEAVNFNGVSEDPETGLRQLFDVPYAEFIKFDLQYVASWYINKKHKLVFRSMAGMGFASGNSPSLPYEHAFFAGGSNDIRAFEARTMAPGSTKTYEDKNSTLTQIGDTRFEVNTEWRFEMTSLLEGAVFVDAGNIWNLKRPEDAADDPSILKLSSWKEVAVGVGYGIRADFDFLIVRLDLAFPLHNPHLPEGERWWLSTKDNYDLYFKEDANGNKVDYKFPHQPRLNFGIGYPF